MARIFCIANQKGGVGKTTTTVNLAAALVSIGQRVLLIDLDPQGNATTSSGLDKRDLSNSIYDVLLQECGVRQAIFPAQNMKTAKRDFTFDVIGANRDLAGAEIELVNVGNREWRLKNALGDVMQDYDFVLIDCPPALNLLTLNGLCASEGVIVPMQCEYFALEGLADLTNTVRQVHKNLNPNLCLIGLLRVMFDPRITLQNQVSDELKKHYGKKVFETIIPRNVRLAEAASYGRPAVVFDYSAKGSKAFIQLANEMTTLGII